MPPRSTKSFESALMKQLQSMPGIGPKPCLICGSADQEKIETALRNGVPNTVMARTLQDIGLFPKGWTVRHGQEKVSIHKKDHMNGDGSS